MEDLEQVNELLVELRNIIDERQKLSEEDRKLSSRKAEIEQKLISIHERTKLQQLKGGGLTISFDPEALRVRYDPERWADLLQWASENGHEYIVQRRLNDSAIISLVTSDGAMPPGVTFDPYVKISIRRN
ncbi:MAG: hypothetical protein KatS3mg104_3036 [Phycisphaerae bacterium]|nr:MAG: hypothetical protein KatS3mg104_3036 [Phycisphaerae bacterium]